MPKKIPEAQKKLVWLYDQYAKYNKKFWDNRLTNEILIQLVGQETVGYSIDCRSKNPLMEEGCTTTFEGNAPPVLEIAEFIMNYPPFAKGVLLHEMVHVSGVVGHGRAFKDEVKKIAKLGALEVLLL